MRNPFDPLHLLIDPPFRGPIQLVLVVVIAAVTLLRRPGRYQFWSTRHPSIYEEIMGGNPSDVAVLLSLGLLIWIGYAIAITIADYRNGHW